MVTDHIKRYWYLQGFYKINLLENRAVLLTVTFQCLHFEIYKYYYIPQIKYINMDLSKSREYCQFFIIILKFIYKLTLLVNYFQQESTQDYVKYNVPPCEYCDENVILKEIRDALKILHSSSDHEGKQSTRIELTWNGYRRI